MRENGTPTPEDTAGETTAVISTQLPIETNPVVETAEISDEKIVEPITRESVYKAPNRFPGGKRRVQPW